MLLLSHLIKIFCLIPPNIIKMFCCYISQLHNKNMLLLSHLIKMFCLKVLYVAVIPPNKMFCLKAL